MPGFVAPYPAAHHRRPSPPIRPNRKILRRAGQAGGRQPNQGIKISAKKSEREDDGEPPPRSAMPGFVAPYPAAHHRRPSPPIRPNRKILRRAGQAGGRQPNQGIKISAKKSEREDDGEPPPRSAMPGFVAPYPAAHHRRPSPPIRPNRKILRRAGQAGGRQPNQGIKNFRQKIRARRRRRATTALRNARLRRALPGSSPPAAIAAD